jgi:hypothetical protein
MGLSEFALNFLAVFMILLGSGGFLAISFSRAGCRCISLVVTVAVTSKGFSISFAIFTFIIGLSAILMLSFIILSNRDRTQYHLKAYFIHLLMILFVYMLKV